jgi:predicted enzyme related to lactoylglutathione lyase
VAINHLFVGVPATHPGTALAWYQRFFGRPPDNIPNENEAVWQVTDTGLIYVVADTSRAGTALLTLIVDNLEDYLAALAERGIAAGALDTVPGLYRKAVIVDPEGNTIAVAELHRADG